MKTCPSLLAIGFAIVAVLTLNQPAKAATILFDLTGKGGAGLLATNENATINGTPGSGAEVAPGISLDDVTRVLTINIGWGSGKGFTNLTGATTGGHIHGPTASGGAGAFTQDAPVLIPLDSLAGWNSSATNGGFSGTVPLSVTQVTELLAGRYYLNVHTSTNSGGEIRGYLAVVPEPHTIGLLGFGLMGLLTARRRTSR